MLRQVGTGSYSKVHHIKYIRSEEEEEEDLLSLRTESLVAKVSLSVMTDSDPEELLLNHIFRSWINGVW